MVPAATTTDKGADAPAVFSWPVGSRLQCSRSEHLKAGVAPTPLVRRVSAYYKNLNSDRPFVIV
jgi:hypothetical protein